eukprot:GAFH01000940.1.p1 GENE.GAFH01000940.1~~GAFH01000940.1.p1  ORF type:complete len:765 (-),score=258.87 GAFH01000940.1:5-2050(-)
MLGVRWGMIIGAFSLVAGTGIRWWGSDPDSFWLLFAGQAISAFAELFTLGAPTLVSGRWFGDKERVLATTIGSQASNLGLALGFAYSTVLVHEGSDLPFAMNIQFIVSGVIFVLVALFFKKAPPKPPSRAAAQEIEEEVRRVREKKMAKAAKKNKRPIVADPDDEAEAKVVAREERLPILNPALTYDPDAPKGAQAPPPPAFLTKTGLSGLETLWYFFRIPAVWMHVITAGAIMGSFWTLDTMIEQVLSPLNLSHGVPGWIGSWMALSGLVGSLLLSPFVDKFKKFRPTQLMLTWLYISFLVVLTVATVPAWMWGLRSDEPGGWGPWYLWIIVGAVGFVLCGMEPVAMEMAAEVSFPKIPEGSSCTFVVMGANLVALIMQVTMNLLQDPKTGHFVWSMIALTVVSLGMGIGMLFVPTTYHRLLFERYFAHKQELATQLVVMPRAPSPAKHPAPSGQPYQAAAEHSLAAPAPAPAAAAAAGGLTPPALEVEAAPVEPVLPGVIQPVAVRADPALVAQPVPLLAGATSATDPVQLVRSSSLSIPRVPSPAKAARVSNPSLGIPRMPSPAAQPGRMPSPGVIVHVPSVSSAARGTAPQRPQAVLNASSPIMGMAFANVPSPLLGHPEQQVDSDPVVLAADPTPTPTTCNAPTPQMPTMSSAIDPKDPVASIGAPSAIPAVSTSV